jgi:hypothetical protein
MSDLAVRVLTSELGKGCRCRTVEQKILGCSAKRERSAVVGAAGADGDPRDAFEMKAIAVDSK